MMPLLVTIVLILLLLSLANGLVDAAKSKSLLNIVVLVFVVLLLLDWFGYGLPAGGWRHGRLT